MDLSMYCGTGVFDMRGLEIHNGDIVCDALWNGRAFLVDYCAVKGQWVLVDRAKELFDMELFGYEGLLRIQGHISDATDGVMTYWEYRYKEAVKRAGVYKDATAMTEKMIIERMNRDFNLGIVKHLI